jgi:HSF-type DNA-binding
MFLSSFSRDSFFAQTKYASFQRQLNLYGFTRISMPLPGPNGHHKSYSFYTHPHFVRGQRDRVRCMIRCKIKGTGKKRFGHDDEEGEAVEEQEMGKRWYDPTHESPAAPMEPLKNPFLLLPEDEKDDVGDWKPESDVKIFLPPADEEEEWVPPPLTCDVYPDGMIEDGELAFFEGHPFHMLEPLTTTTQQWSFPMLLPFSMQPLDGNEGTPSAVWSPKQEAWPMGDRSLPLPRPKILNREQQRMILDPTAALLCHDRAGPWRTKNVGNLFRMAQV